MPSQKSSAIAAVAREPKRERGKLRVAVLLDAGAACFVDKGFDATTMTEIALRAKTSIGSLYQFFPSKEALADALLMRYGERMDGSMQELAARVSAMSVDELADALVDLMLDLKEDRAAAIVLIDALGVTAERRLSLRQAMRRHLAAIVGAGRDLPDAETKAVMLLHLIKLVPTLAQEETTSGKNLIAEARSAISLYLAHVRG
jgi:AcrR family transcriptional regulator